MIGRNLRWPQMILGLLLAVGGCAGGKGIWPFSEKKTDNMGILSPSEEITALKKMAAEASKATPEQQKRQSELLATAIQKERDPIVRAEIVRTLEKFPTPTSRRVVESARKDPDPDVRVVACEALGRRKDPQAVTLLGETLGSDVDTDVRLAAARALGQTRDPSAVAALGNVLEDPDPAIQYRAVQSLRETTGKDFGNDVNRWRQFVRGEVPAEPTLAERLRRLF